VNGGKNFDRWVLVIATGFFAVVAVVGMWFHNADITTFGKEAFLSFSAALLVLLNRELITNGNGNKNGSGPENPMQAK
jgi:hypothetical protein